MTQILPFTNLYQTTHPHKHTWCTHVPTNTCLSFPLSLMDDYIRPCNRDLLLLTQICQYSLLIKQSFWPFYPPCLPHILPIQTYWLRFQGRVKAVEQVQTLFVVAGDESRTDMYSQFKVCAVLSIGSSLVLWGCINDLACAGSTLHVPIFLCAPACMYVNVYMLGWAFISSEERQKASASTDESPVMGRHIDGYKG